MPGDCGVRFGGGVYASCGAPAQAGSVALCTVFATPRSGLRRRTTGREARGGLRTGRKPLNWLRCPPGSPAQAGAQGGNARMVRMHALGPGFRRGTAKGRRAPRLSPGNRSRGGTLLRTLGTETLGTANSGDSILIRCSVSGGAICRPERPKSCRLQPAPRPGLPRKSLCSGALPGHSADMVHCFCARASLPGFVS